MPILLFAEHDNQALADQTARTLTAARAIGGDIDILVAGPGARAVAEEAARKAMRWPTAWPGRARH